MGETPTASAVPAPVGLRVRAVLVGDRLNTAGLRPEAVVSTTPLAYAVGASGLAVLFRYGAVVLIGLDPAQEAEVLREAAGHVVGAEPSPEEEAALILVDPAQEEQIAASGAIQLKAATADHKLIVADALGKSVALAGDERQMAAVFEAIEPFAASLASGGRWPGGRRAIVRLIGRALQAQHRLSGRVAVREKPDILWDRPDLERFYARLEDEYELIERAETLDRKLEVVGSTATALLDMSDTSRFLRLEILVVVLILAELAVGLIGMPAGQALWAWLGRGL
jgi:required for meiotic nuclear division protein 1